MVTRRDALVGGTAAAFFGCPASAGPARRDLAQAAAAFAAANRFNGVILAGVGNRVVYWQAFGVSDLATHRPMRPNAVFEGGSVSKWIASLVVLRLRDLGRLDLNAPIATYLPDYRRDTGDMLTLEHLMSHASGLPNQVIPALEADFDLYRKPIVLAEAVQRFASGDLQFMPGSRWQYSHSNWLIVQQIVERVSGKSYPALADELLWRPCKLGSSGIFSGIDAPTPRLATSYKSADPAEKPFVIGIPVFMEMIAGYWTDAFDLFRLIDLVRSGKVLSPDSLATLLKVRFPAQRYALGGRVGHSTIGRGDQRFMEVTGASLGYRTLAYGLIDRGESVIMLDNISLDSDDMDATALQMLRILANGSR